jgi:hypothetical protein
VHSNIYPISVISRTDSGYDFGKKNQNNF